MASLSPVTSNGTETETNALKEILKGYWDLCNTFAVRSSTHRKGIFSYPDTGDAYEEAWEYGWKLCHTLYNSEGEGEDPGSYIRTALDLCQNFCQKLFDIRQQTEGLDDSLLKASLELNNQLYDAHNRKIQEAFQGKALDFYITLSCRLTEQRNKFTKGINALLRTCSILARLLFGLRKAADESLLKSALQACSVLCYLFLKGWTQVQFEQAYAHSILDNIQIQSNDPSRSPTEIGDSPVLFEDPSTPPKILVLSTENPVAVAAWLDTLPYISRRC
jgi:hypothetical protein